MKSGTILTLCGLIASPPLAFAIDQFDSIAGFRLGQECSGSAFTRKDSDVRNPVDVLDEIVVSRNQHESIVAGGHSLYVSCSIVDNRIDRISLTSTDPNAISILLASLREKMGRVPDSKYNNTSKPERILGTRMDGRKMESEGWQLSENRKATGYTMITQPFGSNSISDLKWRGGIELSYSDANKSEWEHLKQQGATSTKQKKASEAQQQKDGVKSLLN